MTDQFGVYRVFISSPSDVAAERQLARETIQSINQACSETLAASLMVRTWEDDTPLTPHLPEEKIQDMINKEVEKAHFFILILYKRYGSIEPGHTKSNTEREIETILKRYESNPQIRILAYFREVPSDPDPGVQEIQVREFRERLEKIPIRYRVYKDPLEFKDAFTHDIYNVFLRMSLSPFKQNALKRFWKIGQANREVYPRVAIIFPAVSRRFVFPNDDDIWIRRLEPTAYYEDFRAIYKIQRTLSIIGLHSHKTFFTTNIPSEMRYMNRVWVCFPRSRTAIENLERYAKRTRFRFEFRTDVSLQVAWRDLGGNEFMVTSPLARYLQEQRKYMDIKGECTARLRGIVCKDFAVLGRFRDTESTEVTDEGFLYDYYFAGIRGLGTWGSAWYLDRKAKKFLDQPEEGDLQLLLEVRYEAGAIADVVDVSDKPPDYFIEQNDTDYIRRQIQLFSER